MYPHGARPTLTPSLSRPRVLAIPASLPVPLHVTSSRKVHLSADGIINIIQEISFYAEGYVKSLAGKQLKEVHSHPTHQERGRFSAETSARVFVGERLIRMHIQTAIRPNTSDSLEIDEVFHFAENQDALVVPIAFEATLERDEGENPAVEFDLSSPIVVTLKQRILKDAGEQYKVLQAIEMRANETDARPTQELARKTTLTQPTNETAKFRERIFAGTDVLRVDRDVLFVVDRPVLSLAERREYMPALPMAPRRRSASLTQRTPRVSYTPEKPRSRSASWSEDSEKDYPTANEDLPTATSPYSLIQTESDMRIPPCNGLRTARDVSPASSTCDRSSRSQRKKWTVNSVVAKPGAATPERYDRARVMRSLSTARNLSLSPMVNRSSKDRLKPQAAAASPHNGEIRAIKTTPIQQQEELGPNGESLRPRAVQRKLSTARNRSLSPAVSKRGSEHRLKTARSRSPNGEIHAIKTIPIQPTPELGPHGECVLVEGMEVLKCAAPVDSLIRTSIEGNSPRDRSSSDCSTAGEIRSCYSVLDNKACESAPLSSPRPMPGTLSAHSTPVRTARHASPLQQQPSSAAGLNKRRGLFGYGTRPTTPSRSARSPALQTCVGASPMHTAKKVVLSPMHTAVNVASSRSHKSHKSQKRSHKESKRSGAKDSSEKRCASKAARLMPIVPPSAYRSPSSSSTTGPTRNLFGTVPSNDCSLTSMITARTPTSRTAARATRSPAAATPLATARSRSRDGGEKCVPHASGRVSPPRVAVPYTPLKLDNWEGYDGSGCKFGKHDTPSVRTARSAVSSVATGVSQSPARVYQPRRLLFGDVLTSPNTSSHLNTARPPGTTSPYRPAQEGRTEDAPKTARAHTTARDGTMTARSPAQSLKTARQSPYDKNLMTGRETRSPCLKSVKTARNSSYDKTARERSAASPARGLPTARGNTVRSPALMTARQSPYDKSARSPALLTAVPSPYDQNVVTGREQRTPDKSSLKTARQSPYDKSARSPALNTAQLSPYEQNVLTARAARSPAALSTKTARGSPYDKTARGHDGGRSPAAASINTAAARSSYELSARSPADGIRTAAEVGKSPAALRTARTALSPPGGPRSVYLAPQMAPLNRQQQEEYTQVVTARAVSPFKRGDSTMSPLRPSMTARDVTSAPRSTMTARDALYSTMSCVSGGRDSDARFTARSPPPPSRSPMAVSRTQSPMTRSAASNLATARSPRSPHVDTGSPSNLYTAREARGGPTMRTGIRGGVSPASLRTAREPRSQLRTAATRTPEHNTMPDSQARQDDSYSEQCQLTFQKTPSGYTQKPTHAEQLATAQQRTPTKTTTDSIYYSARATTPSRTLRADADANNNDVTLTRRTPKRDYSQTAVLHSSPHVRTAVNRTPVKQQQQAPAAEEMPKCSLKTGCQAVHVPRKTNACPDSDKDEPHTARVAMTPDRAALLSARDVGGPRTPSAPIHDMRTPRTARRTNNAASPASSLLRSPSVSKASSSRMRTAVSPDAQSNSNYSNEDVVTARRGGGGSGGAPGGVVSSSRSPRTATARGWAAASAPRGPTPAGAAAVEASSKPRVMVRANQANGKIHVEVCLSFKLNTTGTIRVRGEVASALHPRTVSVNGQQIWSDSTRH